MVSINPEYEKFVYIDGEWWDRVSTPVEGILESLGPGVRLVSSRKFRDNICGDSLRLDLTRKPS